MLKPVPSPSVPVNNPTKEQLGLTVSSKAFKQLLNISALFLSRKRTFLMSLLIQENFQFLILSFSRKMGKNKRKWWKDNNEKASRQKTDGGVEANHGSASRVPGMPRYSTYLFRIRIIQRLNIGKNILFIFGGELSAHYNYWY